MTEDADTSLAAEWIDITLVVLAALLQLRINSYQAESRILRKLQNPLRKHIGKDLKEKSPERRFAELVLQMCKGDNRRSGRMVTSIFNWFYLSAGSLQILVTDLRITDSYLALTVPMLVRSFIVLGTGVLSASLIIIILAISIAYLLLVCVSAAGHFSVSEEVLFVVSVSHWIMVGIFILDSTVEFYYEWRGSDDNLFCVSQAIWKNRANAAQRRRLEKMTSRMRGTAVQEQRRRWRLPSRRIIMDFVVLPIYFGLSVISYHNVASSTVMAKYLVLEVLEMLSVFMSTANNYLVEPRLFVELLRIAYEVEEEDVQNLGSQSSKKQLPLSNMKSKSAPSATREASASICEDCFRDLSECVSSGSEESDVK
ncbi:hypothetical protein FGB62_74g112 [Gracilaria domingensis]|nr:hypothetical protein FGB62_74g112 [Gracilaria domingensis]